MSACNPRVDPSQVCTRQSTGNASAGMSVQPVQDPRCALKARDLQVCVAFHKWPRDNGDR